MIINEVSYSNEEVDQVAEEILNKTQGRGIVLLKGNLGAGKTTLVNAILKCLGAEEGSSPTYSLVNEYETSQGNLYHLDLYRLNEPEEAYDFGIEEILDSDNFVLIEWPEIIEEMLPNAYFCCEIKHESDKSRTLTLMHHA